MAAQYEWRTSGIPIIAGGSSNRDHFSSPIQIGPDPICVEDFTTFTLDILQAAYRAHFEVSHGSTANNGVVSPPWRRTTPMIEMRAHELLQAAYQGGEVAPFDLAVERWGSGDEVLADAKAATDMLVSLRLARYADEGRTQLVPTNAGRYWALQGGFLAFLKEEPEKGAGRNRSPEVEALRANYMALRLKTFWWSFGMSAAGFLIAIISLVVALCVGEFPHRWR